MKQCTCGPQQGCTAPCDRELSALRNSLANLMYVGNRLARGDASPEEWHDAVAQAIPEHAKPIVCRKPE